MVKYYKELEQTNDFILPLLDTSDSRNKRVFNFNVPITFYDKYKALFEMMKDINMFIKFGNIDKKQEELSHKKYVDGLGNFDMETYQSDWQTLMRFENLKQEEFHYIEQIQQSLEISSYDLDCLISFYHKALAIIGDLWPEKLDNLGKTIELFAKAEQELEIYSTIKINKSRLPINVKLPNAWYITPYGDLYNTGDGHKETNLVYLYDIVVRAIREGSSIDGNRDYALLERQKIKENGYITGFDFQHYLNYIYDFVSLTNKNSINPFDDRAYESRIVKTILGVVSAKAGLYAFFEDMQKNTHNPNASLDSIIEATKNDFGDILVRCANFYKIETMLKKTITTSSVNANEELYEYLKRGFDVFVIPPIIIKRDKGIVGELDFNSPIVESHIEQKQESYAKIKKIGYGNLYYYGQ